MRNWIYKKATPEIVKMIRSEFKHGIRPSKILDKVLAISKMSRHNLSLIMHNHLFYDARYAKWLEANVKPKKKPQVKKEIKCSYLQQPNA